MRVWLATQSGTTPQQIIHFELLSIRLLYSVYVSAPGPASYRVVTFLCSNLYDCMWPKMLAQKQLAYRFPGLMQSLPTERRLLNPNPAPMLTPPCLLGPK